MRFTTYSVTNKKGEFAIVTLHSSEIPKDKKQLLKVLRRKSGISDSRGLRYKVTLEGD